MCTLTLAWRVFDGTPVAVAANRDEATGRPSDPPGVFRTEPPVIAPRDAEAGGTWIGFNERGVFAGITNRWTDADLRGERSRGLLVADVLERETAAEAASYVSRTTDAYEYDGFNLAIADATDAIYLEWDGALSRTELDPGVHVVVNVGIDGRFDVPATRPEVGAAQAANARLVRNALEPADDETADAWLERAGTVLGDHDYGVCVHGDGFGTRSSSLIALEGAVGAVDPEPAGVGASEATDGDEVTDGDEATDGNEAYAGGLRGATYRFADGPPCRTPYLSAGSDFELERHI